MTLSDQIIVFDLIDYATNVTKCPESVLKLSELMIYQLRYQTKNNYKAKGLQLGFRIFHSSTSVGRMVKLSKTMTTQMMAPILISLCSTLQYATVVISLVVILLSMNGCKTRYHSFTLPIVRNINTTIHTYSQTHTVTYRLLIITK